MEGFNNIFDLLPSLNVAEHVENGLDYIVLHGEKVISAIREFTLFFIGNIEKFLSWLPWWGWILIIFLASCKLLTWKKGIALSIMTFFIGWLGYWEMMNITVAIVITSIFFSLIIGIPLGVFIAHNNTAEKIVHPILDAMQTTPSFVYLLPAVMLFGLGKVPGVIATTIYALPPIVRMTNLGIRNVADTAIMVADSFGCTPLQKLIKVQLPQAMTMITAGINQTTMMSLGMIITSAMIGAKGLGLEILSAIGRLDVGVCAEVGLCIIFVAITLDRLTQGLARLFSVE
ncbi:MAG: ABC transporter permease subunit [Firmicutes bacterium]|nr:ABC transporter permease subunit [Bacillota bacterium]